MCLINFTDYLISSRCQCNAWAANGTFPQSEREGFRRLSLRPFPWRLWSLLPLCARPWWQVRVDVKLT